MDFPREPFILTTPKVCKALSFPISTPPLSSPPLHNLDSKLDTQALGLLHDTDEPADGGSTGAVLSVPPSVGAAVVAGKFVTCADDDALSSLSVGRTSPLSQSHTSLLPARICIVASL